MQSNGIEMSVLIKDRPIFEYYHNDQVFIEGRSGSNYEIELRNNTNGRVQAVLSVDGLSVIDGKEAGPHSRSYLLDPHTSLRVPGWLLDEKNAAKFAFAGHRNSYASQISDGKSRNNGVIGALVYREKPLPMYYQPWTTSWNVHGTGLPVFGGIVGGMPSGSMPSFGASFSNNASPSKIAPRGIEISTSGGSVSSSSAAAPMPPNQLGTAFGDQTQFATRSVAFSRGEQHTLMSLFYDSLKGLRAKGVPIERRGKAREQLAPPQAFPGMPGCQPPRGWPGTRSAD